MARTRETARQAPEELYGRRQQQQQQLPPLPPMSLSEVSHMHASSSSSSSPPFEENIPSLYTNSNDDNAHFTMSNGIDETATTTTINDDMAANGSLAQQFNDAEFNVRFTHTQFQKSFAQIEILFLLVVHLVAGVCVSWIEDL